MNPPTSGGEIRGGTAGLDIFKIAAQSISGFLKSYKTGSANQVRQKESGKRSFVWRFPFLS